jgi:hypothetical protein
MQADEIIRRVEAHGGEFALDLSSSRVLFRLGDASQTVIADIRRERNTIARLLFAREFLRRWQPPENSWVQ